jgi:D-methionine transport system permease protein
MFPEMLSAVLNACYETVYMVLVSGFVSLVAGIPLGVILLTTQSGHLLSAPWLNRGLTLVVNALRSLPFIILLVAVIPVTRFLIGTSIGTHAAIVPLSIGAIPFMGRVVENTLREIPRGLIEAGLAMGATPLQIIYRILLPECLPGIVNGITLMLITLIGYSAMAGAIGGGGLGDLAIRYGYERFNITIMCITVIILIVMVQCIQMLGDYLARRFSH